jgi:hypothetical protein
MIQMYSEFLGSGNRIDKHSFPIDEMDEPSFKKKEAVPDRDSFFGYDQVIKVC